MTISRKILSPEETASLGPGELKLSRSIRHHAYMRVMQLAIDLFALYDKSSVGEFTTAAARLQGMRGKENSHGAHNAVDAGTKDNALQEIRDFCLINGQLPPKEKFLIHQVYGWPLDKIEQMILGNPKLIRDDDSLLWADRKPERHHTTDLPSWMNLSVDGRMEKKMRPIIAAAKERSLKGEESASELLETLTVEMRKDFTRAAHSCTKMAFLLKQLTLAEKRFFISSCNFSTHRTLTHAQARSYLRQLNTIKKLRLILKQGLPEAPRMRTVPTSIPSTLIKLTHCMPKTKQETIIAARDALSCYSKTRNNPRSVWKERNQKIKRYRNLAYGNRLSAEGTQLPDFSYLFPQSPSQQKQQGYRIMRKGGVSTPQSSSNPIYTPRTPIKKRPTKAIPFPSFD